MGGLNIEDLHLDRVIPDGWEVLNAVVVVKCRDTNGDIRILHRATGDMPRHEALGVLTITSDVLRGYPAT